MKIAKISFFVSLVFLACGLTICIPGICGCITMIPDLNGDGLGPIPFVADILGIVGIIGSLVTLATLKSRDIVKNGSSRE